MLLSNDIISLYSFDMLSTLMPQNQRMNYQWFMANISFFILSKMAIRAGWKVLYMKLGNQVCFLQITLRGPLNGSCGHCIGKNVIVDISVWTNVYDIKISEPRQHFFPAFSEVLERCWVSFKYPLQIIFEIGILS